MSRGRCSVNECNYKHHNKLKSYFRMPKDKDLLKKWIVACKRKDLEELVEIKNPDYVYNLRVCSDHFEMHCFKNKNLFSQGLHPGSVPTLLLYNPPNELIRENRDETVCQERPEEEVRSIINVPDVLFSEITSSSQDESTNAPNELKRMKRNETVCQQRPEEEVRNIIKVSDVLFSKISTSSSQDEITNTPNELKRTNRDEIVCQQRPEEVQNIIDALAILFGKTTSSSQNESTNAPNDLKRKNRDETVCQERPKKMQKVIDATDILSSEASTSYAQNVPNEPKSKNSTEIEMLQKEISKLKLKLKQYEKQLNNKACLVCKYQKLSRKFNITPEIYLCSKHFISKFTKDSNPLPFADLQPSQNDVEDIENTDVDVVENFKHNENVEVEYETNTIDDTVQGLDDSVNVHQVDRSVQTDTNRFSYKNLEKKSSWFTFFTGLKISQFNALYEFLDESIMDTLKYSDAADFDYVRNSTISVKTETSDWSNKDRLCLTLISLKRGISFKELSYFCKITKSNVSIIFFTWIKFMYDQMIKIRREIFEGTRNLNKVPLCFQHFEGKNVTIALEATEITVQIPSNIKQQDNNLSSYEHAETIKFLVGICPSGTICYASEGYVGAISDRQLFEMCDIKNFLKENDVLLTGWGFLIQDSVNDLPRKFSWKVEKSHLSAKEEVIAAKIAKCRVHVERAVDCIKSYNILKNPCPIQLLPLISNIFTVICFLVNFEDCLVQKLSS